MTAFDKDSKEMREARVQRRLAKSKSETTSSRSPASRAPSPLPQPSHGWPLAAPSVPLDPAEPELAEPHKLTPKQRRFVEAMTWNGKRLNEAAETAGMHPEHARRIMRQPNVLRAIRYEQHVLRTGLRARALLSLDDLSEQRDNLQAAVAASRALLNDDTQAQAVQVNVNVTPGYAVDLGAPTRTKTIEHREIRVDGAEMVHDDMDDTDT